MSPSAKGTRIVSEISNKNFTHDSHIKTVNLLETPVVSGGTPKIEGPEKKKGLRGFVESRTGKAATIGAGVLAVGALAFGGFKVVEGVSAPQSNEPVATAPEVPVTEPAPEEPTTPEVPVSTMPDRYNYGITEADIAGLQAMDINTLNSLSIAERAPLALYYTQDLPAFATEWQTVSQNPLDTLPAEINADNSAQEALSVIAMSHRQAMTLVQADDFHFDRNASQHLITSLLINGTLSTAYGGLDSFSSQLDTPNAAPSARSLAASNYLSMPVINSSSDKYVDAAGATCIDMEVTGTTNTNETSDYSITACLITQGNASVWMQR